ncbi:unnamed protein product, partial [marine sediment metagenome]
QSKLTTRHITSIKHPAWSIEHPASSIKHPASSIKHRADSGYDSEANHRFGREVLGIHTIIALNARGFTKTPTTVYRAEMKHQ